MSLAEIRLPRVLEQFTLEFLARGRALEGLFLFCRSHAPSRRSTMVLQHIRFFATHYPYSRTQVFRSANC